MSSDKPRPRTATLARPPVDPRLGGDTDEPARRHADPRQASRERMWRRRRRAILLAVLLMMLSVVTVSIVRAASGTDGRDVADYLPNQVAKSTPESAPSPRRSPSPSPSPTVVESGNGEWTYADKPEEPQKFGDKGTLMSYNVAVEGGVHADAAEFAEFVADTLSAKQGWIASEKWRFTPVGEKDASDFTVYLASPNTRKKLCGSNDTYTSCRNGDAVVVNLERWLLAVPHWNDSLRSYRQYVINHEVGHRLGQGHVVCPKKGKPSPVMAQQTVELRGCEPNAWPYPDGEYITGPPGEYL